LVSPHFYFNFESMGNQEIINIFKLTASLMELHEENPFKIRTYQNAVYNLDKISSDLASLSLEELASLEGVGKSLAGKIQELNTTGTFPELSSLLAQTPKGVIDLLNIKGIGPKKVRSIWKELNIVSTEALLEACNQNKLASLKGFGEKTQESIKKELLFASAHKDKWMYAEAEATALKLEKDLSALNLNISLAGDIYRKSETVDTILLIAGENQPQKVFEAVSLIKTLEQDVKASGPFVWRGKDLLTEIKVEIKVCPEERFGNFVYLHSACASHLKTDLGTSTNLFQLLSSKDFRNEQDIFEHLNIPYIVPELREGYDEIEKARASNLPELITYKDLKGTLHNHSTYSDGVHTLEQMAMYCKELGFEYLGISDHSKSAFYANGLQEFRITEQHAEIDALNQKLAPFKIFKGIESDILNDGSLDYEDSVLASFDFIVASIHSNLKMDKAKATERLIKAIENPYTTILGHPTGRLLLKREGYPIDHKKVIDACAENNVIIEINAHPRRLDLEWKWVRYALEKGIMISINPDAHEMEGFLDMHYGVHVGRKAGLTKEMTFNALSLQEVENYFNKKKNSVKTSSNA